MSWTHPFPLAVSLGISFAVLGCAHESTTMNAVPTTPVASAAIDSSARVRKLTISPAVTHVVVTERGLALTEKVQFSVGKVNVLPASDSLLEEVAIVLRDNPHVKLVEVEGHTSNDGALERNNAIAQERAESVMQWLVAHGVAAGRLRAKGYGPSKPLADNGTEEGREKNRRVEFAIIKEDAPPAN